MSHENGSLQREPSVSSLEALMISGLSSLKGPRFIKSDLNLMQLIKAGKEGVFYQARMTRGTCKGHGMFTCKLSKEGDNRRTGYTGQQNRSKLVGRLFFPLRCPSKTRGDGGFHHEETGAP